MKKVLFRGPVLTQSGYGVHSRQIASWLLSRPDLDVKFQALPWGNTPWIVNVDEPMIKEIMVRTVSPEESGFDVTIQLQLPNEWDSSLGRYNVGITAAVETDRCNPKWIDACNKMNKVIVPSEHAKNCLINTGPVMVPLEVIPEAYIPSCVKPVEELPEVPQFSTSFNFLVFGQITGNNPDNDRKNTFYTLRWLFEEFKDDPDVGIVLKTNAGRNTLIDRDNVVSMMKRLIGEIRKGDYPRLHIMHGDLSNDHVAALYKHPSIKALVSATRGEGFGLPILEAAACGVPVIATGWSGHMDFLKLGKFVSLYYQLGEIHPSRIDNNIFMKGARWANPIEQDFKKRVRKFYNSSSIPSEWARDLSKKVVKNYSLERISKLYDESLKEVLA